MPDEETGANTASEKLAALLRRDLSDSKPYRDKWVNWERWRLGESTRKVTPPYPNAPSHVEPIIDDNVCAITSSESSILWSTRVIAVFLPLTAEALQVKRKAEAAFDTLLRLTLSLRSKIENLFDTKNERGMGIAGLTVNNRAVRGVNLPDFEPIPPANIIVPTRTKRMRDADRVCQIIQYSEREFREKAKTRGWQNVELVISYLQENGKLGMGSVGDDEDGEDQVKLGLVDGETSSETITIWHTYHYTEVETGEPKAWVTIFCKDCPEHVLDSYAWAWPDEIQTVDSTDEYGNPIPTTVTVPGEDRPWPYVQFRYENRSEYFYNVRGIAKKLHDAQAYASANMTAKSIFMDYCCKPFTKGGSSLQAFQWRPGENLPPDVELVIPPRVDPIFDYNMDQARAAAARRVGAPQGPFSSLDKSKSAKTATEVTQTALQHNMQASDAVERFAEPLGELFDMMWQYLKHYPVPLPAVRGQTAEIVSPEIFQHPFLVVPGISGRSANPDLVLRQIQALSQIFGVFEQAKMHVRGNELAAFLFDQLDPKLTPMLVVDPEQAGAQGGAPIEQQVATIAALLSGNKQEGQIGLMEQTHNNAQMLNALAQESLVADDERKQQQILDRAPAQYGREAGKQAA